MAEEIEKEKMGGGGGEASVVAVSGEIHTENGRGLHRNNGECRHYSRIHQSYKADE